MNDTSSLKEYISAVLNNDIAEKNMYLTPTLNSLCYNKTPEEKLEEKRKLNLAVTFLENFGIEVKTEYGFYRDTYSVLKDLGERLYPCQDCSVKWHSETSNGEVKSCHDNCRSFWYEYFRNK